jgi:maltose O-acetyltransferase
MSARPRLGGSSAKELMLAGELYDAQAPELLEDRLRCRLLVERFNALSFAERESRKALLAQLLGGFGAGAEVMAPFQCDYGHLITLGPRTFINYGAVMLDAGGVRIGADVQIGPNVQLITSLHPLDAAERARGPETAAPVMIGDSVWLAAGVIVCPGVSVGPGTVVGAGSVVTRDLPAGHLCVGSPCRAIRKL